MPDSHNPGASSGFSPRTITLLIVALMAWSVAFPVVRVLSTHFSAGALALARFLVASMVAGVYLLVSGSPLPARRDLPLVALAGFFAFSCYHPLFNYAEQTVQSGPAAAIIASIPVFTAILSWVFLKERLSIVAVIGIVVSFLGVLVIATAATGVGPASLGALITQTDPRALLLLICALCTAAFTIISKPLLERYSGLCLTSWAILFGTVPLLVFSPALARELPRMLSTAPTLLLDIVVLGVVSSFVSYTSWNLALAAVPASHLAPFLNFQPLIAAALAWIWLGEHPHPLVYLGATLAIAGVLLVQIKPRWSGRSASNSS